MLKTHDIIQSSASEKWPNRRWPNKSSPFALLSVDCRLLDILPILVTLTAAVTIVVVPPFPSTDIWCGKVWYGMAWCRYSSFFLMDPFVVRGSFIHPVPWSSKMNWIGYKKFVRCSRFVANRLYLHLVKFAFQIHLLLTHFLGWAQCCSTPQGRQTNIGSHLTTLEPWTLGQLIK